MGVRRILFEGHSDNRGIWQRIWEHEVVSDLGHSPEISQMSISRNPSARTLRGMHCLAPEVGEYKAVFCLSGRIQDVVVDIRKSSHGDYAYQSFELDGTQGHGLLIPPGFAHGFLTLEPNVLLLYVMSASFDPELEQKYSWDDPSFGIEWQFEPEHMSTSDANIKWI